MKWPSRGSAFSISTTPITGSASTPGTLTLAIRSNAPDAISRGQCAGGAVCRGPGYTSNLHPADKVRQGPGRGSVVRRLAPESGRELYDGVRLHEPELRRRARHSRRAGQQARTGAAGSRTAHVFPEPKARLGVSREGARGLGKQGTGLDPHRAWPERESLRAFTAG